MRPAWSFLVAFAVVCALAFTSREASAQSSVTGILGAVLRCEPGTSACNNADNAGNHPHPSGVLVNVLNFEDCEANLFYQFQIGVSSPSSSYQLEAWVGTQDCSQLTNRQTSATSVCWPVAPFQDALVNPSLLNVRMQDIASGAFTTTHPVSYTPSADSASTPICQAQTQTGATTLTLYIFFVDGGSNPIGTVQQYPITFDTRAGDVQGNISVGVGDTVLIIGIPGTTDPDTQGYNVYCDPPPGQESAVETVPVEASTNNGQCSTSSSGGGSTTDALVSTDAAEDGATSDGAASDSSTTVTTPNDDAGGNVCGIGLNDAGIPSPGGCSQSSVLIPGGSSSNLTTTTDEAGLTIFEEASTVLTSDEAGVAFTGGTMRLIDPKYLCAQIGGTSTSVNVPGLKDGYYYNVAVAATDAAGNVGPLSNVGCGEPVPVADFWRRYYEAGGLAGGGFCSAQGVGVPAGTTGLGVLMVASMVAIVRRRRRS
jgi:uncharacterized protein (TIGR03382 family)